MVKQVLLNENLPQKLRLLVASHVVQTVDYQGWSGKSNGVLLDLAQEAGFDVLITADQNLNYQQNMSGMKLSLIVLSTNRNSSVLANVAKIVAAIDSATPGSLTTIDIGR